MRTLPFTLPSSSSPADSVAGTPDVDTGGYDVLIGGHGFRLATSVQYPYTRNPEQTTNRRFDSSLEIGEQSLAPLPWLKSQSSFHAGAGQLNLEQGFTAFQYQQEQVEHLRFETSLGLDVWTPGRVQRLPDARFLAHGLDMSPVAMVTGTSGGVDCAIVGSSASGAFDSLVQFSWTLGPDLDPDVTAIDLSSVGSDNNIISLATDGLHYYALLQLHTAVAGPIAGYVLSGDIGSTAPPDVLYHFDGPVIGVLGWAKERLVLGLGPAFYELDTTATDDALPAAKYTHPIPTWIWTAIAESPGGILAAGYLGMRSSILQFELSTTGATPTLTGGASVETLPIGELIVSLESAVGSFLAIGTNLGLRIGSFDTYTGSLKTGPISLVTTQPVYACTSKDRFIYASYTDQQPDGTTGLARVDLSFIIDDAGRSAWAPDLRPMTTALNQTGAVRCVGLLGTYNRLVFMTPDGIHTEGGTPGADGTAWLRTSRIRFSTSELKLFKLGNVRGALDTALIRVTGLAPFGASQNLATLGLIDGQDPGEFRLNSGLNEWLQLQLELIGETCVLSSYGVKAYPAPKSQELITFTVNDFTNETTRGGDDITDPETPRARWENLQAIQKAGDEIKFVEFTNSGSVSAQVLIDDMQLVQTSPPNQDTDFGGLITFRLRTTEA